MNTFENTEKCELKEYKANSEQYYSFVLLGLGFFDDIVGLSGHSHFFRYIHTFYLLIFCSFNLCVCKNESTYCTDH